MMVKLARMLLFCDVISEMSTHLQPSDDSRAYVRQHAAILCLGHVIAFDARRRRSLLSQDQLQTSEDKLAESVKTAIKGIGE